MIITCPYCHKKLHVSTRQLLLKGRLSVGCPICGRLVYQAMRKQLMVMQFMICMLAISAFAWLGSVVKMPGGVAGTILTIVLVVAATVTVNELCCRLIARESRLQYWTDKALEKERREAEAKRQAERQAKKKNRKK